MRILIKKGGSQKGQGEKTNMCESEKRQNLRNASLHAQVPVEPSRAQVPVEPMARVCAAGYDDLSPDSDDDSPRLTKDPRSAACGAEVSPLKPVMPRVLTTVSSMVKHPETSTWHERPTQSRNGKGCFPTVEEL